jgi:hypothetical protein
MYLDGLAQALVVSQYPSPWRRTGRREFKTVTYAETNSDIRKQQQRTNVMGRKARNVPDGLIVVAVVKLGAVGKRGRLPHRVNLLREPLRLKAFFCSLHRIVGGGRERRRVTLLAATVIVIAEIDHLVAAVQVNDDVGLLGLGHKDLFLSIHKPPQTLR